MGAPSVQSGRASCEARALRVQTLGHWSRTVRRWFRSGLQFEVLGVLAEKGSTGPVDSDERVIAPAPADQDTLAAYRALSSADQVASMQDEISRIAATPSFVASCPSSQELPRVDDPPAHRSALAVVTSICRRGGNRRTIEALDLTAEYCDVEYGHLARTHRLRLAARQSHRNGRTLGIGIWGKFDNFEASGPRNAKREWSSVSRYWPRGRLTIPRFGRDTRSCD